MFTATPGMFNADTQKLVVNVQDFAPVDPTGTTDSTTGIANARAAANAAGGGIVYYPPGTYLSGNQPIYSNVLDVGAGSGISIIKLKNGANADLFSGQVSSINLSAAFGSGIVGTLSNFGFLGLTLDGNKANQTSGPSYPLRFYGYHFLMRDVEIKNGFSGGALIDWNGNLTSGMEALMDNCTFHDSTSIGLQMGGPHDSRLNDCFSYTNTSHGFHFAPNAKGELCKHVHPYHLSTGVSACGFLIEANGVCLLDCEMEGADFVQVVVLGTDITIMGGQVFANPAANEIGIQLGQVAGQTPIPGQILQSAGVTTAFTTTRANINTKILDCQSGGLSLQNESNNTIIATIEQVSGSAIVGPNTPLVNVNDNYLIHVQGLTSDGSVAKNGGLQVNSDAIAALLIKNAAAANSFTVDARNGGIGVNASPNSGIAALITTALDSRKGLVVYPNSATQSADLFEIQDQNFANILAVASLNGGGGNVGLGAAVNTGVLLLASPFLNTMKGLVIYPHSSSQTATLLEVENSSFTPVFTVDLNGNIVSLASLSTGQSATAPDPGAGGTVAVANTGVARVNPAAARTACILASGTVAGQEVWVVNEAASGSGFSISWATQATSHIGGEAGGTFVLAAKGAQKFVWSTGDSLWHKAS